MGEIGRRGDLDDALRRAVPLAGARPDRARRAHQPRRRGRLPRAGRAAGRVRGRDADRPSSRPSSGSTRSSCGCGTCCVAGDRGLDGQEIKVFGARECLERVRAHPLWQRRGELPDGEGVGVALGFWPGGLEPAAAICKLDADGKLTVVTAAADMSGIENAFQSRSPPRRSGSTEDSVRVTAGDTASAPYGGVCAAAARSPTPYGRAIERAAERGARAAARGGGQRARDRARGPRARRRRGAPGGRARPRR